jgi:predicted methyltransferase
MLKQARVLVYTLCALALAAPAFAADDGTDAALTAALKGSWREAANAARDQYRHPRETLEFFGLKADMTVVELWPGGGWYTEVLAPVLRDHGQLIAASVPTQGAPESDTARAYRQKLAAAPVVYGKVKVIDFDPPKYIDLGKEGSADMVLTFRNAHNWEGDHLLLTVFQAAFKVLKHGGVLGLTDHRAAAGKTVEQTFKSGYMPTDYIVKVAEQAGFKLAGQSEINANPKDTKDYPKGVWTLPPTYALGEQDKAKYAAIGESDRMTLKFVKP